MKISGNFRKKQHILTIFQFFTPGEALWKPEIRHFDHYVSWCQDREPDSRACSAAVLCPPACLKIRISEDDQSIYFGFRYSLTLYAAFPAPAECSGQGSDGLSQAGIELDDLR